MVKVAANMRYINWLANKKYSIRKLSGYLSLIKCSIIYRKKDNIILSVPYDRMDLFSVEGIVRAIMNIEKTSIGLKQRVKKGDLKINVEEGKDRIHPFVGGLAVYNWKCNDESQRQLKQLIKNIHENYCANKKIAAIEFHNATSLKFPLTYLNVSKEEIGKLLSEKNGRNTRETLKIEQNILQSSFFLSLEEYPAIIDNTGKIVSMPPISISDKIEIEGARSNLVFIVTGRYKEIIDKILKVICANILCNAEKGTLIEVRYKEKKEIIPNLSEQKMTINYEKMMNIIGKKYESNRIKEELIRAGYRIYDNGNVNEIDVGIPFYRVDVHNVVDVISDLLLFLNYYNETIKNPVFYINKIGKVNSITQFSDNLRELMIGFGFQEVITSLLIEKKETINDNEVIEIKNPLLIGNNIIRNELLSNLIRFLQVNRHAKHPIKIFEIGETYRRSINGYQKNIRLAAMNMKYKTSFEEMHGIIKQIFVQLGLKVTLKKSKNRLFIDGRTAVIMVKDSNVGIMGEINPEIIKKFRLRNPITAFEIKLDEIMRLYKG